MSLEKRNFGDASSSLTSRTLRELYEKSMRIFFFKMFNISQLDNLQHVKFKRSLRDN